MSTYDHADGLDLCIGVLAVCGIRFQPRPVAFARKALPGEPLDPAQICPTCQAWVAR